MSDSRIPGFYRLTTSQRHSLLRDQFGLSNDDVAVLLGNSGLDLERASLMVENCVGVFGLPIGLGLNFVINDKPYIIPMVVEEPSIIAAVSNSAKAAGVLGGFTADADGGHMIAQVQLVEVQDVVAAEQAIMGARLQLLALANSKNPGMVKRGGGALELEVRTFETEPDMLVVHLIVDCVDAMGANAVNTMAEGIAPLLESLTGARACLRILSNLADRRCARARCRVPVETLKTADMSGQAVAQGIVDAYRFAHVDPYRAATHNKGIMNGIDAVAIATGNDWRSVGRALMPMLFGTVNIVRHQMVSQGRGFAWQHRVAVAVGVVGGSTGVHPTIVLRKLLNVQAQGNWAW